jgi:hypothetical protein
MSSLETVHLQQIYDELVGSLGREAVFKDPQLLVPYSRDDSFTDPQPPALVAWPRSTADV